MDIVRAMQNYENFMLKTHDTDVIGIDVEVMKNSSLGIEGWALYAVGEDWSPSDDDNNHDLFPEDNREKLIITDPSARLVVGGPAPVVISGHRPGEDRHGENIFDGAITPVAPLAVGSRRSAVGTGPWTKIPCVGPLRRRQKCSKMIVYDQSQ